MKKSIKFGIMLFISVIVGILIAMIDLQPNWDDAGITAGMLVIGSGIISFFYPGRPYIWGLVVSCWIPMYGIIFSGDFSLLIILSFGLAGAYIGSFFGNRFKNTRT